MSTSIAALIAEGAARLARIADDPAHEAQILLAAALDRPRSYLYAHATETVLDCEATDRFEANITRRALGEPIAYVLGEREFWSLTLAVGPEVLIPRPETELVVERALVQLDTASAHRVLDLAAGSGAIALALAVERPLARVIGSDASAAAVAVAQANARRLHLGAVEFRLGPWYETVPGERFDLIASNPPYIADDDPRVEPSVRRYEPAAALYAGPTGLEALGAVVGGAPRHLRPAGWLLVEHGDRQAEAVRARFAQAGFTRIATWRDLGGAERVTEGQLSTDRQL